MLSLWAAHFWLCGVAVAIALARLERRRWAVEWIVLALLCALADTLLVLARA